MMTTMTKANGQQKPDSKPQSDARPVDVNRIAADGSPTVDDPVIDSVMIPEGAADVAELQQALAGWDIGQLSPSKLEKLEDAVNAGIAHSIAKGVVNLDEAVRLTHVTEDTDELRRCLNAGIDKSELCRIRDELNRVRAEQGRHQDADYLDAAKLLVKRLVTLFLQSTAKVSMAIDDGAKVLGTKLVQARLLTQARSNVNWEPLLPEETKERTRKVKLPSAAYGIDHLKIATYLLGK